MNRSSQAQFSGPFSSPPCLTLETGSGWYRVRTRSTHEYGSYAEAGQFPGPTFQDWQLHSGDKFEQIQAAPVKQNDIKFYNFTHFIDLKIKKNSQTDQFDYLRLIWPLLII